MNEWQKVEARTALMRADAHMHAAEGMAPAGLCTQWVQLARVEIQRAMAHIGQEGQEGAKA